MKKTEFIKLREVEDLKTESFELNENFLFGDLMIKQKFEKTEGQDVTYFKVVEKRSKTHMRYIPITEKLE